MKPHLTMRTRSTKPDDPFEEERTFAGDRAGMAAADDYLDYLTERFGEDFDWEIEIPEGWTKHSEWGLKP